MLVWKQLIASKGYSSLTSSASDEDDNSISPEKGRPLEIEHSDDGPHVTKQISRRCCSLTAIAIFLLVATVAAGVLFVFGHGNNSSKAAHSRCTEPAVRREWRTLSAIEKDDYINAVKCLGSQPSALNETTKARDDFAWIHVHLGGNSHKSASFLAWHRYFIHLYESLLRNRCGYKGYLPYWEWTLDWNDFFHSPVWDDKGGFGGNGNGSLPTTIGSGSCVTTGPFTDWNLAYAGSALESHCLSRGFNDGNLRNHSSSDIRPEVVERILRSDNYRTFFLSLEDELHDAIPNLIRGDFLMLSAPNEPLFWLHHGNLDRLWWSWQRRKPETRNREYIGPAGAADGTPASLDDVLPMQGYGSGIKVSEVIDTESGALCYRYD